MGQVEHIITKLGLEPLVDEGGFFVRTYTLDDPAGPRPRATSIYYLVSARDFSALHRLHTDEIYHFYAGDAAELVQIDTEGRLTKLTLGPDVLKGQHPQVTVAGGVWQGVRLKPGGQWALMGATMTPGFDASEFELGRRAALTKLYPRHRAVITRFTRAR